MYKVFISRVEGMNLRVWLWKVSGGYFLNLIDIRPFFGDEGTCPP